MLRENLLFNSRCTSESSKCVLLYFYRRESAKRKRTTRSVCQASTSRWESGQPPVLSDLGAGLVQQPWCCTRPALIPHTLIPLHDSGTELNRQPWALLCLTSSGYSHYTSDRHNQCLTEEIIMVEKHIWISHRYAAWSVFWHCRGYKFKVQFNAFSGLIHFLYTTDNLHLHFETPIKPWRISWHI